VAGAAVQWLRDGLGLIRSSSDVEALAASVPDNGGVYLVCESACNNDPLLAKIGVQN
jgi:glycerol kinase